MALLYILYTLFTILTGFLLIIYAYFKYVYTYFEKRHLPYIEPSFPFGNFAPLIFQKKSFANTMKDFYDKMKNFPAFGVFAICEPVIFLSDPEMIKQCLVKQFPSFHDRNNPINEEITPLFGHLFFLHGEKWKNLRSKLSPAFTSGKMKFMFSTFKTNTQNFLDHIKLFVHMDVDVEDLWGKLTTDIIASCAFGIECNSFEDPFNDFRQMGIKSSEGSVKLTLGMILINSGQFLRKCVRWSLIDSEISDYFINIVKETMEYREKNNIMKNDFLQLLIDLKNNKKIENEDDDSIHQEDDGKSLTLVQCAAQAYVFFLGGFGTTASTLTFAAYELALNQDVQLRLQNEIDVIADEYDGITYESINKMVYLDQVIKETLRKYPPLPWLNRMVTNKVEMEWPNQDKTVEFEKGLKIFIPIYAIHHDPKYYPDPECFYPDRFSEENIKSIPQYAYIPFGEGPHNCIGSRFGLMQTKVALAMLLEKYYIQPSWRTVPCYVSDPKKPLTSFKEKLFLRYTNRFLT